MRDQDDGRPAEDTGRQAAQEAAGELARMGLDPAAFGLDAVAPPPPPAATYGYGSPAGPPGYGPGSAVPGHPGQVFPSSGAPAYGQPATGQPGHTVPTPGVGSTSGAYRMPGAAPTGAPPGVAGPQAAGPPSWNTSERVVLPAVPPTAGPRGAPRHSAPSPPAGAPAVTRPSVGRHSVEAAGSTVEAYPAAGPTSSLSRPLGNRPDRHQPAPAGAVPRAPMTPEDYGSALADVTEQPGVVLPAAGWRRAVRAATFGLLQPGAAAAMDAERRLVARARTRRREPRMVAFVAGKGGVGTTTTALGVALTLAALRTDLTAVVDARHGAGSLGRRLAGRTAPTVAQLTEHRGPQPPLEPMRLYGSLGVVDGLPWYGPPPGGQLVQLLDHLREQFTFTLTDVGNDVGGAGQSVLGRADQVVVVTTPSHDAAAAANTALGRVYQVDPYRLTSVTIAVVCVSARQYRRAARSLRDELGLERNRIVPVPYDPQLAAGSAVEPKLLRPATREAYLRIAGFLADPGPADLGVLRRTGQGTAALPTVGGAATPAFPAVGAVADR